MEQISRKPQLLICLSYGRCIISPFLLGDGGPQAVLPLGMSCHPRALGRESCVLNNPAGTGLEFVRNWKICQKSKIWVHLSFAFGPSGVYIFKLCPPARRARSVFQWTLRILANGSKSCSQTDLCECGHFKYMAATDLTVTLRTITVTLHHGHAGALGTLPDVTEFALASWEWWKIWWLYWTSPFLTALHLLTSATPLPSALSKYTFSTLVHCLHSVAPFSALPQNPGANEDCVVFLSCQGPDFIIHKTGADSSCFPQSGLGFYKTVDMEMPIDSYPHPAVLLVLLLWRVFVCNAFDPKLGIVGDWSGSNALCS